MTPEYVATKRGENRTGSQLYHRANFHVDRCHRRRDIPGHTKLQTHAYFTWCLPCAALSLGQPT